MIPVYSNSLGEEEIAEITKVLHSKWLGMGRHCAEFEKELAAYWGVENVLLVNNCTSALLIALKALGIGKGDEVIISTINFVGCANAVMEVGAVPVFADVDPDYFQILPSEIERLKTSRTKAIYLLHYGGHPCDFDAIHEAAGRGIAILEDSANSVASIYKDRYCGTLGDAGAFSFDAMKTLVMGDGGALILRDAEARRRAKSFRYLGFCQNTTSGSSALKGGNDRWWEFDLDCHAGRFISNDILASIGRVQLKKLPAFIKRRKEIWDYYQEKLGDVTGLKIPPEPRPDTSSSYYMYWIQTERRDELAAAMAQNNIYSTFRYFPLHLVPYYQSRASLPNAESVNQYTLNIPLHQNLSDGDVENITEKIKGFFAHSKRKIA